MSLAGRPMVEYSLQAFRSCAQVDEIVLICAAQEAECARQLVAGGPAGKTEKVVVGGATRQESVRNGLREVRADTEIVLVHDAARPLVTGALIARCISGAQEHGAAIAAVVCADTVKHSADARTVGRTVPREGLYLVQTPQGFRYPLLQAAFERAERDGFCATDEGGLIEHMGRQVALVEGSPENIKVTTRADHALAEAIMLGREGMLCTGLGYDVHRFAAGRRLVLGGVEFAGHEGLAGHSDADVMCHAVADAVLGCACAGDIGRHFPDSDAAWRDANSLELLARAAQIARERGCVVVHADVTLVAQEPRIGPRADEMRANIGRALGIAAENVSVKATTTEGLGFAGRKEGIACYAVCTARRTDNR